MSSPETKYIPQNERQDEKDDSGDPQESTEIDKNRESEIINEQYESLIRGHNPIDSGQEGLIFKLTTEEVLPQAKAVLQHAGVDLDQDSAVKVLKIFNQGRIEHEYQAHNKAYELLNRMRNEGHNDLALVPKPIDYRKIHITPETQEILNREGAQLDGLQAEVMMMDFVEGEDLQKIFYRWIVKNAPKDKQYAVTVDPDKAEFPQLYQAVAGILEFGPMSPSRDAAADEEINSRREKVFRFLKRSGFKIKQSVVDQIRKTREVLQNNRIYHNDEHERNFILKDDQVYIIDFARATESKIEDEMYFELDKILEQLIDEYQQNIELEKEAQLRDRIEMFSNDQELSNKYKKIFEAARVGHLELNRSLMTRAIGATASEQSTEEFIGLVLHFVNQGKLTSAEGLSVVDHMKDTMRAPVYKRGKVSGFRISNQAVYNKMNKYKELFK